MDIQHTDKEKIESIARRLKGYDEKDFVFTDHYWFRIAQRDIDHDFVIKTFFEFEKVRLIEEKFLKKGDLCYTLYYEISNSRTLIVWVCPVEKLLFITAMIRPRKWQSALKNLAEKKRY